MPNVQQSAGNVLPDIPNRLIHLHRPVAGDRLFDPLDLAVQLPQPFRQSLYIASGFNGQNDLPLTLVQVLQLLLQRVQRDARSVALHFGEPPLQLLLALFHHVIECAGKALLDRREHLLLKPVLPDHQLVAADTSVLVLMAAVLHAAALASTGADYHAAATLAADQGSAEEVAPATFRSGHTTPSPKLLTGMFAALLDGAP